MDVKRQAKDTAHNVAENAKDQIREAADNLKRDSFNRPKENLTERMDVFADAIRRTASELRKEDQSMVAGPMDRLAEGIGSFSESIRNQKPSELLSRVQRMGRENPGALFGTFAAVGFLMSRGARSTVEAHRESPAGAEGVGGEPYVSGPGPMTTATTETRATVTPIRTRTETEPLSDVDLTASSQGAVGGVEDRSNLEDRLSSGPGSQPPVGATTPYGESETGVSGGYGDSTGAFPYGAETDTGRSEPGKPDTGRVPLGEERSRDENVGEDRSRKRRTG